MTPVRLATVNHDQLVQQYWDLLTLMLKGLERPLTFDEVGSKVEEYRKFVANAKISWETTATT